MTCINYKRPKEVKSGMLYCSDLGFLEIKEWFKSISTTFMVFSISRDFRSDLLMTTFGG